MSAVTITTLSENTARHGFIGEWGLSMLIESSGRRILLDTGWSFTAVYNAQLLGIDLDSIDVIVLSHGHHDHTGGLLNILKRRKKPVDIIAHPDIWSNHFTRYDNADRFTGIPYTRQNLESQGANFVFSEKPVHLAENILTTGEIPRLNDFELGEEDLLVKDAGSESIDPLNDDQAIVINHSQGLIIVTGCAHHGIVNTIQQARNITGREEVYAIIGGTHLHHASPERIALTAAALHETNLKKLGVSHCTGFPASSILYEEFPDSFFLNNAGTSTNLP